MKHAIAAITALAAPLSASQALAACPATTFDGFLAAFSESTAMQRQYTANPLTTHEIDPAAEPEPKMVTQQLPVNAVRMPIMPNKTDRARNGLQITKTAQPGDATEVKLAKADTGYQLVYLFRKNGACWQLSEFSDESL